MDWLRFFRSAVWTLAASLAVTLAVSAAVPAWAGPPSGDTKEAEAKAIEAKFYYARGLFREAAETFFVAFTLSNRPDMLYNAARAYEQAKLLEKAKALYESYLLLPGVSDDGKKDAQARIAAINQLQSAVSQPAHSAPAPDAVPKSGPGQPSPTKPEPAKPEPARTVPAPAGPAAVVVAPPPMVGPAQSGATVGAWIAVGGGSASIVASAVLYGLARNNATKANNQDFGAPDAATAYNQRFDKAQTERTAAIACAVIGAGAAGWGAWSLWRAHKTAPPARSTHWWVAPAPGGFAAGATW